MAGAIKGITIEFNGDTTKLDKALRTIRKDSRGVDSDLRAVNRALKFNPTSAELLRQKFTLLGQKVNSTEKELKQFRDIEKQLKAQGVSKTSSEFMRVRRNQEEYHRGGEQAEDLQRTACFCQICQPLGTRREDEADRSRLPHGGHVCDDRRRCNGRSRKKTPPA